MGKKRADRKPKDQWESLKDRICALYEHHTLQDVIEMLRDQDKFVASKRQLVYRLNKWHCKKYNITDEEPERCEDKCAASVADRAAEGQGPVSWDHHMADALFAAGDNQNAWGSFWLKGGNPQSFIIALARSAETKEQCDVTLGLLMQHMNNSNSPEQLLYCYLLYILVCDTMGCSLDEDIDDKVGTAVSCILGPNHGFLMRIDGSIDLLAYALLDAFNENHNHLLPQKSDEDRLAALLYDFEEGVRDRTDLALRQCAQWCHWQLFEASKNLDGTKRPNLQVVAGRYQGLWKDHLEIFGTLWNILVTQRMAGAASWATRSLEDLNLTHAEMLSCVCWVIIEAADCAIDGSNDNHDPVHSLFTRARSAAHEVSHQSVGELWSAFREAFMRLNSPTVAVTDENSKFGASALDEFRVFIHSTLSVLDVEMTYGDGGGNSLDALANMDDDAVLLTNGDVNHEGWPQHNGLGVVNKPNPVDAYFGA